MKITKRKIVIEELKEPIQFSPFLTNITITCTTVVLDFRRCPSFKYRVLALLSSIYVPYHKSRNLSREYRSWVKQRLLNNTKHKLRWMADHYLLWLAYCLLALFKGYVEGFKWEIPLRGDRR